MSPTSVGGRRNVIVHRYAVPDPADRVETRFRRLCAAVVAVVTIVSSIALWFYTRTKYHAFPDRVAYFGYCAGVPVFTVAILLAFLTRTKARTKLAAVALRLIPTTKFFPRSMGVFALLILFSGVSLYRNNNQGYAYALGSILVSGAATVLVAFGGWFTFQVTFGFVICRQLCISQRKLLISSDRNGSAKAAQPKGSRPKQATAVLERLFKHNYALLSSLTIDAADAFVTDLIEALNEKYIVSLVIERHVTSGNYVQEIQAEFQTLLRRLQVSPHPFLRSTESYSRALQDLLDFRRIVVIIRNMDAAGYSNGPHAARKAVQRGIHELTGADIPFITIVHTNSLPGALTSESIAITPPNDLELTDTSAELTPRKRLEHQRAIRRLAVALQPTGLQVNTVLAKHDPTEKIINTTDRLNTDGLVRFGCDLIGELLRGVESLSTMEKTVLQKLIDRLIMTGGLTVGVPELYDDLDGHSRLDVSRSIQNLVDIGMLTDDFPHDERRLGYRDPRVGEIAMGWALARRNTPFVASIHRTALCSSAEIFGRIREASTAPFPHPALPWPTRWGAHAPRPRRDTSHVWRIAMDKNMPWMQDRWQGASPLAAVGAAISAAVSENNRGDFDDAWLQPLWDKADSTTRRNFVDRLTTKAACRLKTFLWAQACGKSGGIAEMHTLDRSISRALGSSGAANWNGTTVWSGLQTQWVDAIATAGKNDGQPLWWEKKKTEEVLYPQRWMEGHSLSLLGWTLPSLLVSTPVFDVSAHSIKQLLTELKAVVAHSSRDGHGRPRSDVGMQIALAEGCRDACYLALTEGIRVPDLVTKIIHELLDKSSVPSPREPPSDQVHEPGVNQAQQLNADSERTAETEHHPGLSWYARLVALQSLFVAAAAETDRDTTKAGEPPSVPAMNLLPTLLKCQGPGEHPIIRRYASLLIRELRTPHDDRSTYLIAEPHVAVGKLTWLDDNKAVSEAGGELDPEVVLILAEAVCLLNFAGASELNNNLALPATLADSPNLERGQARIDGLKSGATLPVCFTRKRVASNALHGCSGGCTVGMCGPGMYDAPIRRELSPTFIERCLQLTRLDANFRQCRKDALLDMRSGQGAPDRRTHHAWTLIKHAASKFRQNRALRVHLQQMSKSNLNAFKTAISAAMPENVPRSQWMLLREERNDAIGLRLYHAAASNETYAHLNRELAKTYLQASDTAASADVEEAQCPQHGFTRAAQHVY